MKKATFLLVFGLILVPAYVSASWWNPFSWKKAPEVPKQDTEVVATSTPVESAIPSVSDLLKRIAELEDKLDKARAALKKEPVVPAPVETKTVAVSEPASSGLSNSQISSKVRPAIVLVETATSSASGVIIDSTGHILTSAHGVWTQKSDGTVIGAAESMTVTLSSGAKKKAVLIGIDESADLAILQLSDKSASTYLKLNHDAGLSVGDKVAVVTAPSSRGNGGSTFVPGTITKKSSYAIESTTDDKPLDNGGALVTASGNFVGIPTKIVCKVLEEGTNCLKYTVTSSIIKSRLSKLLDGMQLYKDKQNESAEEILVHGQLIGFYNNIKQYGVIDYAVESATGKNSFDYFNNRLADDMDGKLTKLYLNKLKSTSENIYRAFDLLKTLSYDLRTFLINESSSIADLGDYQRKVLSEIQSGNTTRLADYKAKVDFWTKKKNEYDGYLTHPSDTTHDYLMEQGVVVENAAAYLQKERSKLLDIFSGESVDIF